MASNDSEIDELIETWIEEARYFGEIQGASMGGIPVNGRQPYTTEEVAQELKQSLLALIGRREEEKELKARLVELDLLEQFMNSEHPVNSDKNKLLFNYKMSRLKDLTTRIDELQILRG